MGGITIKNFKVFICDKFTSHSGYDDFSDDKENIYSFKKQNLKEKYLILKERILCLQNKDKLTHNEKVELNDKLGLYNKLRKKFERK